MFTGLVETIGRIASLRRDAGKLVLGVVSDLPMDDVVLGESIAVDGCCLTVTDRQANIFYTDAAEETLRRTSLAEVGVGSPVHLERALRAGARLGGHFVQGHVDGVGRLSARRADGEAVWVTFEVPCELTRYMVSKGSIAIDGVSLTLTEVGDTSCAVMLVPFSQTHTHLAKKQIGARVNLEVDVLAKYVEKLVGSGRPERLTQLMESGFI